MGLILVTLSIFVSGVMIVYFYLIRYQQSKVDNDNFFFSLDEDKNDYSKKIKFLNE